MRPIRSFVAIELDQTLRSQLAQLRRRLDDGGSGVRWVAAEQLHLTLKFIGDIRETDLADICPLLDEMAAECDAFDMTLRGAGCFPPAGPARIVWAGLEEPTGALARLQQNCERLFAGLGYKQEHRGYRPHVTLARVRDARAGREIRPRVAAVKFEGGTQAVDEVVLFQSLLGRQGAAYVALSRHALHVPGADD